MIRPPCFRTRPHRRGVALVIVLAFVVLVTGVVLAFFSRAQSERQISDSSSNETRADIFAQGAYSTIIGDLQEEIAAGSVPYTPPSTSVTVYAPRDPTTMTPSRVGTTDTLPNLVKRSANGQAFFAGSNYQTFTASNRASGVPSTTAALHGRTITPARWNKGLLLPKKSSSATDATPITDFVAPDWVLVARDGSNPTSWNAAAMTTSPSNATSVVGRYAYSIYDEGGLLDANAAGYPAPATAYPSGGGISLPVLPTRKASQAYADLTISVTPPGGNAQPLLTVAELNALVGWRNYASGQPTGSFPTYTPHPTPASSATPAPGLSPFDMAGLTSVKGFLAATGPVSFAGSTLYNKQSDRMFGSRQQLIDFFLQSVASGTGEVATLQNSLGYLGTFSRSLNQPSYVPVQSVNSSYPGYVAGAPAMVAQNAGGNNADAGLDTALNPAFPAARVLATFTRNDGSDAVIGEALVKKRFALNRLAWLTCKGPSAPRATSNDADIVLLKQYLGGGDAATAWLQQGTDANIQAYFGLEWKVDTTTVTYDANGNQATGDGQNKWFYDLHNGSNGSGAIRRLYDNSANDVAHANREPDFFELLKATVRTGALGKTTIPFPTVNSTSSAKSQFYAETSVDYAIMQIAANIIDQYDTDNIPTRIVFNDGSLPVHEFRGVENLPYINRVRNCLVKTAAPKLTNNASPYGTTGDGTYPSETPGNPISNTGVGAVMLVPELWNPHDYNASASGLIQTQGPTGLGPTQFRIYARTDVPVTLIGHTGGAAPNYQNRSDSTTVDRAASPGYATAYQLNWNGEPHAMYQNNTEMDFTVAQSSAGELLFREPTMLLQAGKPNNSSLTAPKLVASNTALGDITKNASFFSGTGGGLTSAVTAQSPGALLPMAGQSYVGFYVGTHPLQYMISTGSGTPPVDTRVGVRQTGVGSSLGVHYYLQCLDPSAGSGQWVTYDEKYEYDMGNPNDTLMVAAETAFLISERNFHQVAHAFDPRTSRFGLYMTQLQATFGQVVFPPFGVTTGADGWLDQANNVVMSNRDGVSSGTAVNIYVDTTNFPYGVYVPTNQGWHWSEYLRPGLFSQNDPNLAATNAARDGRPYDQTTNAGIIDNTVPIPVQYYTDADNVARRAMGAYTLSTTKQTNAASAPASAPGLPMATATNAAVGTRAAQSNSRPVVLNRPFYSPADLGYVFSDTPWKNLNLMFPESGYAALLDVFCVQDTDEPNALAGGRINLNTRQMPVLQALLAGAYKDEWNPATTGIPAAANGLAQTVATALVNRTNLTGPTTGPMANKVQPLTNVADLVGRWASSVPATSGGTDGGKSYDGFSADLTTVLNVSDQQVGRFREATIRGLSSAGQTRVWNLMIDLIAQTGRYPQNASGPASFNVEGEQRYWVHLAIDRYTGQVLDKYIEVVKE